MYFNVRNDGQIYEPYVFTPLINSFIPHLKQIHANCRSNKK